MNKEQLINRHARNLKSLVGTGLAQDECQDIIKYAVNEALTMKKFSERRKIVENIPRETFYCYTPDQEKNKKAEKKGEYGVYYIKPCNYYKHKKGLLGRCKLYKCEIIDQVKSCGLRE